MISTASIIILGPTGVNGRGGICFGAGSSSFSSSGSSSSTTAGTIFFAVRDRVVLVVDLVGPTLALAVWVAVRVDVRVDVLEGRFFDGGVICAGSP